MFKTSLQGGSLAPVERVTDDCCADGSSPRHPCQFSMCSSGTAEGTAPRSFFCTLITGLTRVGSLQAAVRDRTWRGAVMQIGAFDRGQGPRARFPPWILSCSLTQRRSAVEIALQIAGDHLR